MLIASAGKRLYYSEQYYYGVLPTLNAPAVAVGTNPFDVVLTIPFEMPPRISKDVLSPQEKNIEIDVNWGRAMMLTRLIPIPYYP